MRLKRVGQAGFTLVEISIALVVISIVVISMFGLFITLVNSAVTARRRAVALTLANNQMEYLKSLPYDSLAVANGSISSSSYLPATTSKVVNNISYTITTSISYADDAYDGCGSYPTQALKQTYCRNYPPPSGAPTTDQNPADYKIAHVAVKGRSSTLLAVVDTEMSARVSETASTTGALFVSILDGNGSPVSGATVSVVNASTSPIVNVSDSTDSNGIAIFYGLPPDSSNRYVISGTKSNYSSLTTIATSGSLQPTYANQKILTQQASYVALKLQPQAPASLAIETTDTSGAVLQGVKVYTKGGYKKYTATSDTSYYFDNMASSDTRPTTDSAGLAAISNLAPGDYIFCGDDGSVSCTVGATKYYLAAAVPYGGSSSLNPISVPAYDMSSPPATPTYTYNGTNFVQKVRLMLTTNANFPRVYTLSPQDASIAAGLSNFTFTIGGQKLPCSTSPGSCGTTVKLQQGSTVYTASCTGASTGLSLSCTANLTGITTGMATLTVSTSAGTLALPVTPLQGGLDVTP